MKITFDNAMVVHDEIDGRCRVECHVLIVCCITAWDMVCISNVISRFGHSCTG